MINNGKTEVVGGRHKTEQKEEFSFGQQLQNLRTQKEIDLKTISKETRIAMGVLVLLEESAFDRLPDVVFVTGFIRSYAKAVGAQPDTLIQNYLAGRHHYLQTLRFEADLLRKQKNFWPRLFLTGCIVVAAILWFQSFRSNTDEPADVEAPPSESAIATRTATAPVVLPEAAEPEPAEATETEYTLAITAVDTTWIKIIVDRGSPKQYDLNPGDHMEVQASSMFNLLIGNAAAVTLKLNGKPVTLEGKRGQAATLKLPR